MSIIIPTAVKTVAGDVKKVAIVGRRIENPKKWIFLQLTSFLGMSYSGNTESYSNGLQGRTAASSPYSSYGATTTSSHLAPKDMVSS